MRRYGEMEAATIAALYASLPMEEFVQEMVTGLNLAFMRGAADAFRVIGEAADRKVETILDLIVSELAEVEAMGEEPRVNAQVEGAPAPQSGSRSATASEGFKYEDLNLVDGPEGAR